MTTNAPSAAGPSQVPHPSLRLLRNVPARSVTIDLRGAQNLPATPDAFLLYLHNLLTKRLDWHQQWAAHFIAVLSAHLDSDRVKEYRATKAPQLTDDVMVLTVAAYTADLKDYKDVSADLDAVTDRGRNHFSRRERGDARQHRCPGVRPADPPSQRRPPSDGPEPSTTDSVPRCELRRLYFTVLMRGSL
jgi:hypothetical protein